MAKPIALFIYPDWMFLEDGGIKTNVGKVMQSFNETMPDYYWLCLPNDTIRLPKLQVFRDEEFTPTDYEQLNRLIKRKLRILKNEPAEQ